MKRLLGFILLFSCQLFSFGQIAFDISKVKGHSILKRDKDEVRSDTLYGPIDISLSKHKYEIRLSAFYGPVGNFEHYILFSDGREWTAQFWESELYNLYDTTKPKWRIIKESNWDSVLNILNSLDFFVLPSQNKLKKTSFYVMDGSMYTVSFKIDRKFREYYFNNPSSFREHCPQVKEYGKYERIVETFFSSFRK